MRSALLAMLLCGAFLAGAQTMYRWVDEKGRTHYSQEPPPDGKAQKVEVKPSGPAPRQAVPGSWKQRDLDSRARRLEKEQKEDYDKATKHNEAADRTNRCNHARRELRILETQVPVYTVNEKDERVYLDDKDRAREIEEWKRHVQTYCD
jgi:hypothetical protein